MNYFSELMNSLGDLGLEKGFEKPSDLYRALEHGKRFNRDGVSTMLTRKAEPETMTPALDIFVEELGDNGYRVFVDSVPPTHLYHRETESPIPGEQLVDQIKQYLGELTPPTQ